MTAAIAAGLLMAAGVYLILQRGLLRVIIGFVLLGHAANIIVVAAGGMRLRAAAILDGADPDTMADPLPQAFVLTAIVITFGITVYLLAVARAGGDDDPAGDTYDPDPADAPHVGPDEQGEAR
jgi:multicomponent Na+:H+ antiporter subunit C